MKAAYFIILLTLAFCIKLKTKDYLVNNDKIKDKFLSVMGEMNSVLQNTIKLMKDNTAKLGIKFNNEKSEEIADKLNDEFQKQLEAQQKKEEKKEQQEQFVGQQQLVGQDTPTLDDLELNDEGVDDSQKDAFQMVDDNEGIAQEPDIEF